MDGWPPLTAKHLGFTFQSVGLWVCVVAGMSKDCSVCLDKVCNSTAECGHRFCFDCISEWAINQARQEAAKCPECRKPLRVIFKDGQNGRPSQEVKLPATVAGNGDSDSEEDSSSYVSDSQEGLDSNSDILDSDGSSPDSDSDESEDDESVVVINGSDEDQYSDSWSEDSVSSWNLCEKCNSRRECHVKICGECSQYYCRHCSSPEEAMCIECLKSEQRMDDPMDIDETPSPPLPSPSPLGLLGQFVHAQLQPRASSQRAQPQPSSRRPRPQSANPFLQAFGQHQHGHASPAAASLSRIGAVLHGRSNRGAGLSTMARQPSRGATGQPSAPRQAVVGQAARPREQAVQRALASLPTGFRRGQVVESSDEDEQEGAGGNGRRSDVVVPSSGSGRVGRGAHSAAQPRASRTSIPRHGAQQHAPRHEGINQTLSANNGRQSQQAPPNGGGNIGSSGGAARAAALPASSSAGSSSNDQARKRRRVVQESTDSSDEDGDMGDVRVRFTGGGSRSGGVVAGNSRGNSARLQGRSGSAARNNRAEGGGSSATRARASGSSAGRGGAGKRRRT